MTNSSLLMSSKELKQLLGIIMVGFLGVLLVSIVDNPIVHVICIWSVCLTSILISKLDLLHPYCSFSVVYTLYSSGYAILYCLGQVSDGYSKEQILYSIVGLIVLLIAIGPRRVNDVSIKLENKQTKDGKYLDVLIVALEIATIICAFFLMESYEF